MLPPRNTEHQEASKCRKYLIQVCLINGGNPLTIEPRYGLWEDGAMYWKMRFRRHSNNMPMFLDGYFEYQRQEPEDPFAFKPDIPGC